MADVVLIYPYFRPKGDKSIFRFPPLGLGYVASYLSGHGVEVQMIDCTFRTEEDVVDQVSRVNPGIIGIQCVLGMERNALRLARLLKKRDNLLVAGGPHPTTEPTLFLMDFDLVVLGEGERTALEIVQGSENGKDYSKIPGIAYRNYDDQIVYTEPRHITRDLDSLPFPSRALYPNCMYQELWRKRFGYSMTSLIATRGCPFMCDYCSRAVSGSLYRERSKESVVDEMEEVLSYGYDRIWIADDVFTLRKEYVTSICQEILNRRLKCQWECLSRVDTLDLEMARQMEAAGCVRVFFGIESGSDAILRSMRKNITTDQAAFAIHIAREAGISTGAFFILGYPGETDNTILQTLSFSNSLPLDYLSFTFPYPFPGTGLYEKVKDKLLPIYWSSTHQSLWKHKLVFKSSFSEFKLKFAVFEGTAQFKIRKILGRQAYLLCRAFGKITDLIFRLLK